MDANVFIHQSWIGMAQPDGLVVTAPALKAAEANIAWPVDELQDQIRASLGTSPNIGNLRAFYEAVLGWRDDELVERDQLPDHLKIALDGDLLVPDLALRSLDQDGAFALLVNHADRGQSLDRALAQNPWAVSAQQRFERLLVESGVHVGLLTNGAEFRLVYAPKGQSAGTIKFLLADMLTTDGRQLLGAFVMLLNRKRLLTLEPGKRLSDLLHASREYQNTVSAALRQQILSALRELLDGFQHADRVAGGRILGELRRGHLQEVYSGLVSVLMRTVFVLYAEEKRLLPIDSPLYDKSYSLTRLHAQLSEDWDRHGDTLYDRYGAWARLITLFRVLHNGLIAAEPVEDGAPPRLLKIPARRGDFFSADTHPFLEGRTPGSHWQTSGTLTLPRISDGVVFRVLDALLVLHGERLQYKGLDVEHIGSVYEGLMGFEVEVAEGPSLALSNLVVVDLEKLLSTAGAERVRWLKEECGVDLKDKLDAEVKAAKQIEQLHQALARRSTGGELIAVGSLYLQPGEERRRTGSHYTPRKLTQPIVETTLRPVLERLGSDATPEQILSIRVCDPAMGSGAFLVEACRQLGARLVAAWRRSGQLPAFPADESPEVHAQRLVAQRCLYGVDKNPLAVNLARLSLWLETFAKDHPFTFVDHLLRHGDSLVGLTRKQITAFHWDVSKRDARRLHHLEEQVKQRVNRAEALRKRINAQGDPPDTAELKDLWERSNEELSSVRLIADVIVATFFANATDKLRAKQLEALTDKVLTWLSTGTTQPELAGLVHDLREGKRGVPSFHWEIEFPELFDEGRRGFDCFIGNPPYSGKNGISAAGGDSYIPWLQRLHPGSHGNADLSVHFFRRGFDLLSETGTLGFVATKTIAQGDSRTAGLKIIVDCGGVIYEAKSRTLWDGSAAVAVVVVHVARSQASAHLTSVRFDGAPASAINSRLRPKPERPDPVVLEANANLSFVGTYLLGMGFTLTPLAEDPRSLKPLDGAPLVPLSEHNAKQVFPFLGGDELNTSPTQSFDRYIICFAEIPMMTGQKFRPMAEIEARKGWPELMEVVERLVKPERLRSSHSTADWWQPERPRGELYEAIAGRSRCLVISNVTKHCCFSFQPIGRVWTHNVAVFAIDDHARFAVLQSRIHEVWARLLSATLEDRLNYRTSDCFETFPFPGAEYLGPDSLIEKIGQRVYEVRAQLMIERTRELQEDFKRRPVKKKADDGLAPSLPQYGLTKLYNEIKDPDCLDPRIVALRELHLEMDRAVWAAYGWPNVEVPPYTTPRDDEEAARRALEAFEDEVIDRLFELNAQRAEAERKVREAKEAAEDGGSKRKAKATKSKGPLGVTQGELLLGQTAAQGELGMGLPPRKKR